MKSRIALDAMGGDALAVPNLQGACKALVRAEQEDIDLKIFLCGPKQKIEEALPQAEQDGGSRSEFRLDIKRYREFVENQQIELVDCEEVVGMDESPSNVVRAKRNSSMAKTFQLVKSGEADAAVSAGNSGAMMAYGVSILGRLPLVKRPAILCHFPSDKGDVTALLDMGANVDCTSQQLEQFALMGKIYVQAVFEKEKPRVALLNIGEEESKGNELVKETHSKLKVSLPENYVGFVEGRDLFFGKVDVIVCDGFVGNVVLKTTEGVAKAVSGILKEEFSRNPVWGLGAWIAKGGFRSMKNKLDYREYGAAPLIGLEGLGLVAHGSSDGRAMANSIRIATHYVQQGLMKKLFQAFSDEEDSVAGVQK